MTNLFIGLSKNHIDSFEAILDQNKNDNMNILITSNAILFNKFLWDEVISIDESFNNQSYSTISSIYNIYNKIRNYKKIIARLDKFRNEKKITLFFTYIEDILTNYLLLSFNSYLIGVVVEDGTLNYYGHTIKNISPLTRYSKWILSNCIGVKYRFYKGHSSGIEYDHVVKQYVKMPELSVCPEKSVQLPFSTEIFKPEETVLIVGQEAYINMSGLKRYQNALKELIELINKKNYLKTVKKVYYKPHRHGQRINYNILKENLIDKEVEILEKDMPLERLYFEKLKSKYIFSFDSSVLLNIYIESCKESREMLDFNVLLKYNKELYTIFKKFKFSIYS